MSNEHESEKSARPALITVDPTLMHFDSTADANKQSALMNNVSPGRIAWRVRSNAATRYIVTPGSGYLIIGESIEVHFQLAARRCSPQHKFVVQAFEAKDGETDRKKVWKDERAKRHTIQSVPLQIAPVLLSSDETQPFSPDQPSDSSQSFSSSRESISSSTVSNQQAIVLEAKISVLEATVSQLQSDNTRLERQLNAQKVIFQTLAHERAIADETRTLEPQPASTAQTDLSLKFVCTIVIAIVVWLLTCRLVHFCHSRNVQ